MRKNRFENPHIKDLRRNLWHLFLWKIGCYDEKNQRSPMPADFFYPALNKPFDRKLPSARWIGHSTFLIEIEGLSILTDPVWDLYCSPIPFRSLKRRSNPPLSLVDLPPIDLVLQSHNHYDHLDAKTVAALHQFHPGVQWVVPAGLSPWFRRRGIDSVLELKWWESKETKNCKVTAVPTQHFSGRSFWDMNKTHWNGYVLECKGKRLYFTGDTGYNSVDFKEIGRKFGSMDLSLIPIGTYVPEKFMQPVHISPKEAVQIHKDVGSHLSLGMHWNTFRLSDEPLERPPFDLYLAMQENLLPLDTFLPIAIGDHVNW